MTFEENEKIIKTLPQIVNLVDLYFKFDYPFTMQIPSYIGQLGWQENKLSLLEVFFLWIQKIYNNLINAKLEKKNQ